MGRELQKKKKRSSIPKIKIKPKSKKINPLGNAIIAANWDQKQTLTQNYSRLGLTSRINTVTGGIEKLRPGMTGQSSTASALAIYNMIPKNIEPTEARVERDPETGKIMRVIHAGSRYKPNPLNDLLNSDSEDEEGDQGMGTHGERFEGLTRDRHGQNDVVRQLEKQASTGTEKMKRKQSEREKEWIERLVARYGSDFGRMARDRRLNPMQQTARDIERRVAKWRAGSGEISV